MMLFVLVLCKLYVLAKPVQAQSARELVGWPPVQVIGVEQGLPQAFVSGLIQDDWGYIWVGTLGGVARYDGRQMIPFYHHPNRPASPRSNIVIWLERGGPNDIWLRYENGNMDRMNAKTGQCQHFPLLDSSLHALPGYRHVHVDRQGNIWGIVPNDGLFQYDVQRNRFTRYRQSTHGLVSDTISCLAEDRQGHIWVVSPKGLSLVKSGGRSIRSARFRTPLLKVQEMIAHDERVRAFVRPNGEIMLNDQTNLLFIDPRNMSIRSVAFASHKLAVDQPLLNQAADGTVHLMAGGTLYRYEDKMGITPLLYYRPLYGNRQGGLQETGLCLDRTGVLWIGANTKGLFRVDLVAPRLQAFHYQTEFCIDAMKKGLGLSLPNFFRQSLENNKGNSSYFFRTTYDSQGRLWMGLGNEIGYYSFQTRSFTRLPNLNLSQLDLINPDGFGRGIAVLPNNQVWVVSNSGKLYQYRPSERRWQSSFEQLAVEPRDLVADFRWFWATTGAHGLLRYDTLSHQCRTIHFDGQPGGAVDEPLLSLYQDRTHPEWLWIGSYRGLIGFNKRTERFRRFTTANGLPNNTVYSILPDKQGYLWLSTNRGLCRFHPVTHTTLNINLSDGLPGEEFNRFHHLPLPDGRLAFGGVEGWVLFDPAQIKADTTQPMVMLTDLKINNQPVDILRYPGLTAPALNTLSRLQLAHDQNYLTLGFAALNDHQPDRVTYRYQLEGYDKHWTTTNQPSLSYTQLPPGNYTLHISAINSANIKSPKIRELAIVVSPPYWASGWAIGLYALLLGTVGWLGFRFWTMRAYERRELLLRQRQAHELARLNEAKTRFFSNVSHELRTPLTLMLAPLNSVLSRQHLAAQDEQHLKTVDRNARQLIGLVNELLDLNRLEAGKLTLNLQETQLSALLTSCLTPFTEQAQQLGLTLRSDVRISEKVIIVLDADKLKRVLQNLLANALKFTQTGGSVTLQASIEGHRLHIAVIDTGRGIHPNDLPYVFDRYFQTQQPGSPLEGGTGIGLSICQELIQLMHGHITVSSSLGQGSSFDVNLPFTLKSHQPDSVDQLDDILIVSELLSDSVIRYPDDEFPLTTSLITDGEEPTQLVLIVEDNADLRAYLTDVLTPSMAVLTAANGQVALRLLDELPKRPALVIADIMMPIVDGFQLVETLKAHPVYRMIPVIMLTARVERTDKLRALRLGVDDYLLKPFEEVELIARVTNLLRNQRERQAQFVTDHAEIELTTESSPESALVSADDLIWLENLETITRNRLSELDLTVDDLADDLAMSRRTLYRTLKRLTGMTPAEYITEARFRQARYLLETRQVSSVKQVAYRVGYQKVSYFSQLYQQRFGKSPSDY